jgi:CRISPR system Cascade subunit CasE
VLMNRKKQLLAEKGLGAWKDWPDTDPEKPLQYQLVQETCTDWLLRRAERCGFRLINEEGEQPKLRVDSYQQQRSHKKDIRFSSVNYSGVLEVVDTELMRKALFEGIGHAKAFGCGLMLIRPV